MTRAIDPEHAREFWEGRYREARVYGTEPTSAARDLAPVLRAHRVRTVLEAGCGSGRDALHYAREGFEVTGLDLSRSALGWIARQAEAEGLRIHLREGDLLEADLPLGAFDATVAIHLVHLQPEPIRRAMVNRLWRLTRDAGLIVMVNFSTQEPSYHAWEPHFEPNTRVDPKGKTIHFFDAEDLEALLPPDRFEILSNREIDLAEIPDGGPVTHKEWLTIARKVCAC
jgi:SAM-dependent methyltransferase